MGLGPVFKSVGKAVSEHLPETLKSQSVVPALKKGGVTDEELSFANVAELAKGQDKVASSDVTERFAAAEEQFGTQVIAGRNNTLYDWVNIKEGGFNPSYKERIITFGEEGRYTSPHFPEAANNYLMHNRSQDDFGPRGKERQLVEIQSDLHQSGRKYGYAGSAKPLSSDDKLILTRALDTTEDELIPEDILDDVLYIVERYGFNAENGSIYDFIENLLDGGAATKIPKSPWEKTWLKKGIEIELADALSKGLRVLSVPIKGGEGNALNRAEGVQKWYETTVVDTMKKIAKQQGYTFEMDAVSPKPELVPKILVDEFRVADDALTRVILSDSIDAYEAVKTRYDGALIKVLGEYFDESVLDTMSHSEKRTFVSNLRHEFAAGDEVYVLETLADFVPSMKESKVKELATKLGIDPNKNVEDIRDAFSEMAEKWLKENDAPVHARIVAPTESLDKATVDAVNRAVNIGTVDTFKSSQSDFIGRMQEARVNGTTPQLAKELGVSVDKLWTVFGKAEDIHKKEFNAAKKSGYEQAEELLGTPVFSEHDVAKALQNGAPKKPSFTLYSTPAAAVLAALAMKQEGYSDEEIEAFAQSKNVDVDELRSGITKAQQALDEGIPLEEIRAFLDKAPITPKAQQQEHLTPAVSPSEMWDAANSGNVKAKATLDIMDDKVSDLETLVASMQVVHPNMTSVTLRTAAFFGNERAARIASAALESQATKIVNSAKEKFGIDLAWDPTESTFYLNGKQGLVKIEPGITKLLAAEGVEITAATIGAVLGAQQGKRFGNLGAALGSVGGAIAGSVLGTEMDYLVEAMNMQVDMSQEVAAHKALTAAEASVVGDVIGLGLVKGVGSGWQAVKRAKDYIIDGNSQGAYEALKEVMFLSDSEANEIVSRLGSVIEGQIPGNDAQRALAAAATTSIGGDFLVAAAGHIDPLAGRAAVKAIDSRAKDLLATASSITDANAGQIIREDLNNYVADVKNFYQAVKNEAASSPLAEEFTFNYNKLALNPVLERLNKNITDPIVLQKFLLQASKIRNMSTDRSFTDLLELRQLVNDFKFNKRITNTKDFDMLNDVLTNIDEAINVGARTTMGDSADEWLVNYASARAKYAEMKTVQKNVLYKALMRGGRTEAELSDDLVKYVASVDDTYADVVSKLPEKSRHLAEGKVIENLTDKFTAGIGEGIRAVHFPLLNKELQLVSFTSPEARQYKAMVGRLAEVFKNDVELSKATGQIQIPHFQSYLTADPVVRLKFEIASGIFNKVKTFLPGKAQRNMALVNNLAEVLETPLNSKAARTLMDEMAGEVDVAPQVVRLQQEEAKRASLQRANVSEMVKVYGEGAVRNMQGKGTHLEIPASMIAKQSTVKTIADADGIAMSDVKALDFALKQRGYAGVMAGTTKVRLLK